MMENKLVKAKAPLLKYFRFENNAVINGGKGVGYLTEKLKVCSLSPVAL